MEKIKITDFYFYDDPDLSELDVFINTDKPPMGISIPVNDDAGEQYDVYLNVDPDNHRIVSATIFYSANLFEELAQAFANKDLNNPNVRFFLEKKLEAYAQAHADELQVPKEPIPSDPKGFVGSEGAA